MSGSEDATWLGAHLRVARPRRQRPSCIQIDRHVPRHLAHGLGGTAGNEYSVDDFIYRDEKRDHRSDSPLYRFTKDQLY